LYFSEGPGWFIDHSIWIFSALLVAIAIAESRPRAVALE